PPFSPYTTLFRSDLQPLPRVVVRVVGGEAGGALAPEGEAVVLRVEIAGLLPGGARVEQVTVLGDSEEDQAIDGAQQLFEQRRGCRGVTGEALADRGVGFDQPLAELGESGLDAFAQPLAGGGTLPEPGLARLLERGAARRRAGSAEAAGVGEQPPGGEVGEHLVAEHRAEVGLDPRLAGEAGVVAHQPDL